MGDEDLVVEFGLAKEKGGQSGKGIRTQ